MKQYKVKITKIIYDLDGLEERELSYLPQTLRHNIDAEDEEELQEKISDYISDITGFCHKGFSYDIIETNII